MREITERGVELLSRAGLRPTPKSLTAVTLVVGIMIVASVVRCAPALTGSSSGVHFESSSETSASTDAPAATEITQPPPPLVVHVVGSVHRPGVFELPADSRVSDAIQASGGVLSSAAPQAVNLARVLIDGEQIYVPSVEEWESGESVGAPSVPGAAPGVQGAAKLDLNSATSEALESLPGIGPATATKIVADRDANGPFAAPEELMRVSGIGPKKFEAIVELITVL